MRSLKKFLAVMLTIALMASVMLVPVFAEQEAVTTSEAIELSDGQILETLGLLRGDGNGVTDEYLVKSTSRVQLGILNARWRGFEDEALAYDGWDEYDNFVDYDDGTIEEQWNLLAYYYADEDRGFNGFEDDTFKPLANITNKQLIKVLLVDLGYEYLVDFDWFDILDFASDLGISTTPGEAGITNSQMASIVVDALVALTPDGVTWAQYLLDEGLVAEEDLIAAGINYKNEAAPEVLPTLEVVNVAANNFAEIELTFNQPIDADSIKKENVRVDGNRLKGDDKVYVVEDYGDGAVLRLFAKDGFVSAQNEKRTVALTGVKNTVGTVQNPFTQDVYFRDTVTPLVEKVVAKGNTRLDIYFTEPVKQDKSVEVLSTYQINDKNISATKPELNVDADKNTSRIVTIKKINTVLTPGTYTLGVFGSDARIIDYAENSSNYQRVDFTIVADTEGPIAQGVVDPTYVNKVRIEFDEEITDDAKIQYTENSRTYTSDSTSVDGNVATFEFSGSSSAKVLSQRLTTVTLTGAKDYSGNAAQAPLSFDVTPIADSVRPTIVDYGSEKEGEIWVKFDKAIEASSLPGSSWVIKDSGGSRIYNFNTTLDSKDNKLVNVTESAADALKAGTYTLTVKDVKDRAKPDANNLLETTFDVKVPDTVGPSIVKAYFGPATGSYYNVINIYFSEKVDYASAVTRSNYLYTKQSATAPATKAGSFSNLPTNAKVELLAGDRLVRITFQTASDYILSNSTVNAGGVISVNVRDVADFDGNRTSASADVRFDPTTVVTATGAKATGKNKIEVYFTSPLVTYSQENFTLYDNAAGTTRSSYTVTAASISDNGLTATLTLNKDLYASASTDKVDTSRKLYVKSEITGILATTVHQAVDGIGASKLVTYLNSDPAYYQRVSDSITTGNALVIVFDEYVKPHDDGTNPVPTWDQIFSTLVIDGKTVTNRAPAVSADPSADPITWNVIAPPSTSVAPEDGSYAIYIAWRSGRIDSKDVKVQYGNLAGRQISDAGNSTMGYWEETVNFRVMNLGATR
jgi:hypothetical protein